MSKQMAKIVPQEVRTIPPLEPRIRVPIQLTAVALDIPKSLVSSTMHVDKFTGVLRVKYPKKKRRHWVTFQAEAVCIPPEQTFKVGRPSQTAAEAGLKVDLPPTRPSPTESIPAMLAQAIDVRHAVLGDASPVTAEEDQMLDTVTGDVTPAVPADAAEITTATPPQESAQETEATEELTEEVD